MFRRAAERYGSEDSRADASLLGLALAIAGLYLAMGVGNVMDDWYTLYYARALGPWGAAGFDQLQARPVASAVYALVFGVLERSIAPTIVAMAVMNGGSAILIRRLVRLILPDGAYVVAMLWLVLPTVTSIEAWASASNISLALLLALASVWLAARGAASPAASAGCFLFAAASVMAYETVLVLVVPLVTALLLFDRQRSSRSCMAALAGASLSAAWVFTHWHPNKRITSGWGNVTRVIPANFVWPIAPAAIGYIVGLLVLLVSALAFSSVHPFDRPRRFRRPIAVGWFILLIGVVPFLKYTYAPVGGGDRVNIVSSIGGALLIGTTIHVFFGHRPKRLATAAVIIVALSLWPRMLMMRSWTLAAEDADRIVEEIERVADPGDVVVLGPTRVDRNGVTAMQHPDIFEDAVRYVLGDRTAVGLFADSPETFRNVEATRIDLRRIIPDPDAPGEL